jgi:hypothetical protein
MNINPIMSWVLRSPLHRLISRTTMLVSYQGRKSGRQITLPVNYVREGEKLWTLSMGKRAWWRNFRTAGPATLRLQGCDVAVQGEVVEAEEELLAGLVVLIKGMPQLARYLKIWYDENGEPDPDDLREAVKGRVLIRFQP